MWREWVGGRVSGKRKGKKGHTIIIIITHNHLLDFPILAHLAPKILIEGIEMVL